MNFTNNKGLSSKRKGIHTSTSNRVSTMLCAHCGRVMNNFAGGYSRGYHGEPLCHPNAPNRPDCYRLVTVYGHKTPCVRKKCFEDLPNFMDYVGKGKIKATTDAHYGYGQLHVSSQR